jgi:hypothetical protein
VTFEANSETSSGEPPRPFQSAARLSNPYALMMPPGCEVSPLDDCQLQTARTERQYRYRRRVLDLRRRTGPRPFPLRVQRPPEISYASLCLVIYGCDRTFNELHARTRIQIVLLPRDHQARPAAAPHSKN